MPETALPSPPRRRWFRFRLRTLLVLITAFCIWLGWQMSIVRERVDRFGNENYSFFARGPNPLPWYRRSMGDAYIESIVLRTEVLAAERQELQRLFPEAQIVDY